ncbi:MAG TPA: tetratricopeptide repeat protein [Candidatus Hydrogenedentes bacterium]|nr:tetratricopeptide repeat protein [Candidatus Hydrogenedentota bacterium]HRT20919.1 tetratricopeptide repeat protein [Candidatus Hydrogenedentota bacterium]HRT63442.1 tetratricopeptide repeat protein [Candidatus Hydrogenedentota bacterium]
MATRVKKKAPDILEEVTKKSDWSQLVEQIQKNPVLYGAGAAFVVLCIIAGLLYRANVRGAHDSEMARYARAMENEDPGLRAAELENVAKGKSDVAALALYMMGEAAFEAKQYDKARDAFERLRKEHPESPNVADAVEGLGNLAENEPQYEKALEFYREVAEKWPGTFAARRQDLNIGRCLEHLGKLPEAVAAYQAQVDRFPGTETERQAKNALDRLRKSNPDLFPKAEEKPAEAAPEASSASPEQPTGAAVETAPAEPSSGESAAATAEPAEQDAPAEAPEAADSGTETAQQ